MAKDENDIFLEISNDLFYNTDNAINKIDSLKRDESNQDAIIRNPYCDYFDSFLAYRNSDYQKSLELADSALSIFLWNKDKQWEVRCLLVLAFTSEALTLHNEALSYYETIVTLTDESIIKGLAYIGLARSKYRLKKNWQDDYLEGKRLLVLSKRKEFILYSELADYWFYPEKAETVNNINSIAQQYKQLNIWYMVSNCHKLIAKYYEENDQTDNALKYINIAINDVENTLYTPDAYMSSIYLFRFC